MGAKDFDFVDEVPKYEKFRQVEYRSKRSGEFRRSQKKAPSSKVSHTGIHQRRNKHWSW